VPEQDSSGTVVRVVRLMQELAAAPRDLALGDLAEALSLPPSTAHRLLKLLASLDIVERSADGHRYQVGREFTRIGLLVASNARLRNIARPILRSLSDACSETVVLCEYLPATRRFMVIDHLRSAHPLRYEVAELQPNSLLWGATGRAILAFLPAADQDLVLAQADPSPLGEAAPRAAELRRALAEIRAQGFATTQGQRISGAVAIAAPVFRAGGEVCGSLCITAPEMRFPASLRAAVARAVMDHAGRLSEALGHLAPPADAVPRPKRRASVS
jgi:DNA-binding IclR family transcriptional regulator